MNENKKKVILILSLFGITGVVYTGFRYVFPLVVPFLLALVIAKLLYPIVRGMKSKCRLSTKVGAPLVTVLFTVVLGALVIWLGIQFANQLVSLLRNIPVYWQAGDEAICNMCTRCDKLLGWREGDARAMVVKAYAGIARQASETWLPVITDKTLVVVKWGIRVLVVVFLTFVSTLMLLEDRKGIHKGWHTHPLAKELGHILSPLRQMSFLYARVQLLIFCCVFVICAGGLFLVGNPYALLLALLIAVIDAFPILGSGSVLVPWGIYAIIKGNLYQAAILLTCYVVTLLLRELMESHMIGKRMGIHPFYLLIMMFLGVEVFGIAGVLLGPFGYLVIKESLVYISGQLFPDTRPS